MALVDQDAKVAKTAYNILEPVQHRWSPRAFADQPVEREKLRKAFDAARWAASSYNEQPWRFILGQRGEDNNYDRVLQSLVEFNQSWAQSAPVLMLIVGKLNFTQGGRYNRVNMYDCGAAAATFCYQATQEGLYTHQMAGVDIDKAHELFGIDKNEYQVYTAMAVGYLGDPSQLPDQLQQAERAPRERKPINELVFTDGWGGGEL
jgi:nitroreductase